MGGLRENSANLVNKRNSQKMFINLTEVKFIERQTFRP